MQYMEECCFYKVFIGTAHNGDYMQYAGERLHPWHVNPCHYFVITLQANRHDGYSGFVLFIGLWMFLLILDRQIDMPPSVPSRQWATYLIFGRGKCLFIWWGRGSNLRQGSIETKDYTCNL